MNDKGLVERVIAWLDGGCSSWNVPSSDIRQMATRIEALEAVALGQPKSSIEFHQHRGIMADSILAALEEYRGYMLDDDYNANGCLDRVVKHLERARPVAEQLEESALSLMQPEIDRRVAEEKAKLFERLRTPSEGVLEASKPFRKGVGETAGRLWQAMLTAFQQENSDA